MASGLLPLAQLSLTKLHPGYEALAYPRLPSSFEIPTAIFWPCQRKVVCDPVPPTLEYAEGAWTS